MDLANTIFAVMLPVALMSVPIFAIWTKYREKVAELEAERYAAKNYELEERMRNLELIITDRGFDVASQIEALRDVNGADQRAQARQLERNS